MHFWLFFTFKKYYFSPIKHFYCKKFKSFLDRIKNLVFYGNEVRLFCFKIDILIGSSYDKSKLGPNDINEPTQTFLLTLKSSPN